jgi:hypothetical protein
MKKSVLLVGLAALGGATCIDLEGAYDDCVRSGRCGDGGAVADAGDSLDAGADSGIDAGRDAGTDAGADGGIDAGPIDAGPLDAGPIDAGPYDGGPVCAGSTRPRLRCAAPLTLATGTAIESSALSPSPTGFVAAWTTSTVEIRDVSLDGGTRTLLTAAPIATGARPPQLSLDSRGPHWVAAWAGVAATTAMCMTDTAVAAPVTLPGNQPIVVLTAAMSANGEIGMAGASGTSHASFGRWSVGCPASLVSLASSGNSLAVAATSNSTAHGFRFVETDQINAYNGDIRLSQLEADAGVRRVSIPSNFHAPDGVASIGSTDGTTIFTAVSSLNTNDHYELGVWGTSADLSLDGQPRYFFTDPGWWAVGTCGAGCAMVGIVPELDPVASVHFFSDDSNAASRGEYDVACGITNSLNGGSIAVASSNGKLGVLLTSPTAAKLYLCDPPPLR